MQNETQNQIIEIKCVKVKIKFLNNKSFIDEAKKRKQNLNRSSRRNNFHIPTINIFMYEQPNDHSFVLVSEQKGLVVICCQSLFFCHTKTYYLKQQHLLAIENRANNLKQNPF